MKFVNNIFTVLMKFIKSICKEKKKRTQDGYLNKIQLETSQSSLSVRLRVKEKLWKCPQSVVHGPLVLCPGFVNEKSCHLIIESQKIAATLSAKWTLITPTLTSRKLPLETFHSPAGCWGYENFPSPRIINLHNRFPETFREAVQKYSIIIITLFPFLIKLVPQILHSKTNVGQKALTIYSLCSRLVLKMKLLLYWHCGVYINP